MLLSFLLTQASTLTIYELVFSYILTMKLNGWDLTEYLSLNGAHVIAGACQHPFLLLDMSAHSFLGICFQP